jgi:hypothetical protein
MGNDCARHFLDSTLYFGRDLGSGATFVIDQDPDVVT